MQKIFRVALIALGAVAALFLVAVLAINLYVQSAGTQKRIEHALSSGLRVPVRVTSTIVTPWSGLKASGITVAQPPPQPGDFFQAPDFHASFDWLGLFRRRLEVRALTLDGAKVVWFQSPDGRWELPSAAKVEKPAAQPQAQPSAQPRPTEGRRWEVALGQMAANQASFDFLDDKGNLLLELSGVDLDCLQPKAAGTDGHASALNASLHDRLFLRDVRTNWNFTRDTLTLSSFQTEIGGGLFHGDTSIAVMAKHSPFKVDAHFDRVDVARLLQDAAISSGQVSGQLQGSLDLTGNTGKTSSLNGSAHLELEHGQMQNFPLFEMMGQALNIPDLVQLDLKSAVADLRIVSGVTQVDKVALKSQNLELDAHGAIQSNGKTALQARLTVNAALASRLPQVVLTYFQPGDEEGSRAIEFKVGGTLAHPHTDLEERILGRQFSTELSDMWNTLFNKKKNKGQPASSPP